MEKETIERVKLARKEGYTWSSIGLYLEIPESTLKYYVRADPKPSKPLSDWWDETFNKKAFDPLNFISAEDYEYISNKPFISAKQAEWANKSCAILMKVPTTELIEIRESTQKIIDKENNKVY